MALHLHIPKECFQTSYRIIRNLIVEILRQYKIIDAALFGKTMAKNVERQLSLQDVSQEVAIVTMVRAGNALGRETSPYLRQHALDPVDWQPWNPDILQRAQREQRPILLSIGYSACHWCHVMQQESFQNEEIAELMNRYFLCIKVDREERPDLDNIYQRAAALLIGQGGWPLTLFLTPEGKPFFVGTYFPPRDRYGRSGFPSILQQVARMWEAEQDAVRKTAHQLTQALAREAAPVAIHRLDRISASAQAETAPRILMEAQQYLMTLYDDRYGGFGTAPKFPCVGILQFFLQRYGRDPSLLQVIAGTLTHMAAGGIYDQLGGGFHRYSTDDRWHVPHFEKMLYDNALLARVYLSAYQLMGEESYRQAVQETLDYLLRDMWYPGGAVFATEDADSEGEEGKFYLWSRKEILDLLGDETGALFCSYYGVTGNVEGVDGGFILHRTMSLDTLADQYGLAKAEALSALETSRGLLFKERQRRVRPFRDEKIITAWNGMVISALAKAGAVLQIPSYIDKAKGIASFGLTRLRWADGRLCRSLKDASSQVPAFLEDYAYFIEGLLDLYRVTQEPLWLTSAQKLMDMAIQLFWSDEMGTFFSVEAREDLLIRPSTPEDESYPSAISTMAKNLFYLQNLMVDQRSDKLEIILSRYMHDMQRNPWGFAGLLAVLDLSLVGLREIFIVGGKEDSAYRELLSVLHRSYLPGTMVYSSDLASDTAGPFAELWEGKTALQGQATVYICQGYSCQPPITEPRKLQAQLQVSLSE